MKKKRLLTDRTAGLEDQIASEMAEHMRKEIDFTILTEMLQSLGWVRIVLRPMTGERSESIDQWVKNNCKHGVEFMGLVWVFENKQEAAWFSLKWA